MDRHRHVVVGGYRPLRSLGPLGSIPSGPLVLGGCGQQSVDVARRVPLDERIAEGQSPSEDAGHLCTVTLGVYVTDPAWLVAGTGLI